MLSDEGVQKLRLETEYWDEQAEKARGVRAVNESCDDEINDAIADTYAECAAAVRELLEHAHDNQALEYVNLVSGIHEVYRHLVMDTPEDRALHARHVETADKALALARAALGGTP